MIDQANAVSTAATDVANAVKAAPTSAPSELLLKALENKCKELESACGN